MTLQMDSGSVLSEGGIDHGAVSEDKRLILSTYRIQFTPDFGFREVSRLTDYLEQLGITTIYSSPIFSARSESTHGYDVTDARTIREEFGTENEFRSLLSMLHSRGMSWLQGIVPNHMAYDAENSYLSDVLEKGSDSPFHGFLDIDWNHWIPGLNGKVLAPFLDTSYTQALIRGELKLEADKGLHVSYHGFRLPLKLESYRTVLDMAGERMDPGHEKRSKPRTDSSEIKDDFLEIMNDQRQGKAVRWAIAQINSDSARLDEILSRQMFLLRASRSSSSEINYRRFFAVNHLIALKTEDSGVFDETHSLLRTMVRDGLIDGVRVDHIDGLADPEEYLERLDNLTEGRYTLVEKILAHDEKLKRSWKTDGTTGYDFLSAVNSLLVDSRNRKRMHSVYEQLTGAKPYTVGELRQIKLEVIQRMFRGDLENLACLFLESMKNKSYGRDALRMNLVSALGEILANMSIYRTYIRQDRAEGHDVGLLHRTVMSALRHRSDLKRELYAIDALLLESASDSDARRCFMRLQQLSPAIMAKSFEDTLFFRDSTLFSLNEVGSDPAIFGTDIDHFHTFIRDRFAAHPLSMNTTSTHDTKSGEDFRARVDVLSEIPDVWESNVEKWRKASQHLKKEIDGRTCPSKAEEYYIYQLLLGTRPFSSAAPGDYLRRLEAHMIKYLREGSVNTSWDSPSERWERGCVEFIRGLLDGGNRTFRDSFKALHKTVSFHGFLNSASALALKMMCPGIPDTYQGSEGWNFSMVDPDNRRKVNFRLLGERLAEIRDRMGDRRYVSGMVRNFTDGRIKMYLTLKLLHLRSRRPDLFLKGEYMPLVTKGRFSAHVVSFARILGEECIVVTVPRLTAGIAALSSGIRWKDSWSNTSVELPDSFPDEFEDIFNGEPVHVSHTRKVSSLPVGTLLRKLPVSVIEYHAPSQSGVQVG